MGKYQNWLFLLPVTPIVVMCVMLAINRLNNWAGREIMANFNKYKKIYIDKGVKLSIIYESGLDQDDSDHIFGFESDNNQKKQHRPYHALRFLRRIQV